MAKKNTINDKRLTKKQVLEIIKTEGKLHEEYTKFFEEEYANGYIQQDKVYELPGERYLYVFDDKGFIGGKGDIFSHEFLLKRIRRRQRVRDDYANKRGNSVDHWRFYSKYKENFNEHIEQSVIDLAKNLGIDVVKFDYSYESLDFLSKQCKQYKIEQLFVDFYDGLVAYVGEVLRKRVSGYWQTNSTHAGGAYPFISINSKRIQYMPINVVWSTLDGLEDIDFRKQTANEIRRNASAAQFERDFGDFKFSAE